MILCTDEPGGSSGESDEEFDWEVEQVLPGEETQPKITLSLTPNSSMYGFANQQQGVFTKLKVEVVCVWVHLLSTCPLPRMRYQIL